MNNYITMTISDTTSSVTYGLLEVPLSQQIVDGKTNIITLDGSVSTYVTYKNKRQITHKWAYLTEDEYTILKSFERRQYETLLRPLLTIERLGIIDMPVVLEFSNPQNIVNNCGLVEGVEISMRETIQNSIGE